MNKLKFTYSTIINISTPIKKEILYQQLKEYGYLMIRDERIDWDSGEEYLNLMEEYFEKRANQLEKTGTVDDCFPQYKYQIGIGYENIGRPNYDEASIANMIDRPVIINRDPKWKYFWPFRYDGVYNPPLWIPKDFPRFEQVMTKWQSQLLKTTESVVAQLSLAFGEDQSFFYEKMKGATHLLSPIGCDLVKHKVNTRFSGYHYDLNFLTVHTKSRFPGLFVWLPNGKRVELKIPDKTVLLQPGMQFEFMTGGEYKAGYHEAVFTEESSQLQQQNKKRWRVTSTLFTQLSPDTILQPMKQFKHKTGYGPISVEEQFKKELNKLNYQ